MNDYLKERDTQRKREYQRKWRAEHRDSVRAAQMRYWMKKAAEERDRQPAGDPEPEPETVPPCTV